MIVPPNFSNEGMGFAESPEVGNSTGGNETPNHNGWGFLWGNTNAYIAWAVGIALSIGGVLLRFYIIKRRARLQNQQMALPVVVPAPQIIPQIPLPAAAVEPLVDEGNVPDAINAPGGPSSNINAPGRPIVPAYDSSRRNAPPPDEDLIRLDAKPPMIDTQGNRI